MTWLAVRARRDPAGLALIVAGERVTWCELAARVEQAAAGLARLGVGAGDRVALAMASSLPAVALVHAAQRAGAALVPLNTRLAPPEIAAIVAHAAPAVVVHDAGSADAIAKTGARRVDAATLGMGAGGTAPPPAPLDPAAAATIVYTSGTTGRPKGVVLTHANHWASAAASRAALGVAPGDRWLCCLPLFHVGGLSIVLRSVLDGVPVVLHERFDAGAVWRAVVAERVTLLSLVPTMLRRFLAEVEAAPRAHALRCVLVGGAALDPALHARARARGLPVAATYGLTEAASQVATAGVDDTPGDVGRPLPGTSVRIADAGSDGYGEILVAGPTVTAGYFRDAEATAAALRDGWLHTGDVGGLDGDGRLRVLDRRGDLVVSGGENVYPSEVEAVLLAHPAVAEAAVYGVDDAEWGRRVEAAIVPRAGAAIDEAALRAWCRARLAGYKTPRAIVAVVSLPRTASGKVRRHAVAAVAATARR
ncbi:MAG: o-succinylbenzoate--CoA ligase [Deltaproteobacteria bacterium]|nr:o-succinylbenzoate--CoA ligase [Deltaproteobacteria bacterium]